VRKVEDFYAFEWFSHLGPLLLQVISN